MGCWKNTLMVLALAVGSAHAATNFYAEATVSETNVYLGQVFNLDVIVKVPDRPEPPADTRMEGFNAVLLVSGQTTRTANTYLFRYSLRAKREGELVIPSLRFLAGGHVVVTQPLAITARKPTLTNRMGLETTVSTHTCYVGEPVLLTTVWDSTYPFGALKSVDFSFPVLADKRFKVLAPYDPDKESQAETTGLPVDGTRVLATRRSYEDGGTQHQSLSFIKILIPKKTGKIIVPPSTLICAVDQEKPKSSQGRRSAFQYPSYFDNTFFDQNVTEGRYARVYTESKPLELDVRPLPVEGRPALFSGLVGEYAITVTAEPAAVRVEDPVTLTITVTSSGFMENIVLPPLRCQPLLVNHFEIPSDRPLPERRGKSKIYTQTIRPLLTTITNVPPLELTFFNPASNAYLTVHSASIPLTVFPAEEIKVYGEGDNLSQLSPVGGRTDRNDEVPGMPFNSRSPWFGRAHSAIVIPLLLPLLIAGGLWLVSLFRKRKHHIYRTAKAARASKVFRRATAHMVHSHRMKRAIYEDLDTMLRAYLGDRLYLNPGTLTFREVEDLLSEAGIPRQNIDDLKHLFLLCETYRFTRGFDEAADAGKIVQNAHRIVKVIESGL